MPVKVFIVVGNVLKEIIRLPFKSAPGKYMKEDVAQLKQKFNYKCACCGRSESDVQLTVDHIIPLARGGTNYLDNLQILCKSCNSRKRDRILVQPEVKNATQ